MALVLTATVGSVTANTYCTLAESNTYHEGHVYGATWIDGDDDLKKAALVWATRLLDEQVEWVGYPLDAIQALRWPRYEAYSVDGLFLLPTTTIPIWLKHATAELARYLLASDRTAERGIGISEVTADTVSVVFDKHDLKPFLPPSVQSIVSRYGTVSAPGGGTVKLVRV